VKAKVFYMEEEPKYVTLAELNNWNMTPAELNNWNVTPAELNN
jgi:hypothetical protein